MSTKTKAPTAPPFSLECIQCDDGQHIRTHEEAALLGWTDIEADDGPAWNYLGWCPVCKESLTSEEQT